MEENSVTIVTNNQARDVLHWWDLSAKEQREFDYLDTDQKREDASFFRYKRWVYDLGEFMRVDGDAFPSHRPHVQWDGVQSETYFSGILVKYTKDFEGVIVARYSS